MDDTALPLAGIRVIDLSRFIAGPLCAMILGDLGAEVIKVERPSGEDSRTIGEQWGDQTAYSLTYNRNKYAITVNTYSAKGRELLWELLAEADVLVENYRPGTLAAMGFTPELLGERVPHLVVTSVSGFGQEGPRRDRALFDCVAQAVSGVMYRNGTEDDPPEQAGIFAADHMAGLYAALGTITALLGRERGGPARAVDVAVLDALVVALGPALTTQATTGVTLPRYGNRDPYAAPANRFPTADGYIYVHAGTPGLFARFAKLLGKPELLDDERFRTVEARLANVNDAEALMSEWTSRLTSAEAEERLNDAGIPAGAVMRLPEVAADRRLRERGMLVDVPFNDRTATVPGNPVHFAGIEPAVRLAPPALGADTDRVLTEVLGKSAAEVAALRDAGAI